MEIQEKKLGDAIGGSNQQGLFPSSPAVAILEYIKDMLLK